MQCHYYKKMLMNGGKTIPRNDVQPPVLTWDDFHCEFTNNYMLEAYKDDKRREFLNLKYGTITVLEQEIKFNQLSHYASSLVATNNDECRMFEEELRYEIRNRITPSDFESYTKLKAAIIRAERLEKEGTKQRAKRGPSEIVGHFSRKQGRSG